MQCATEAAVLPDNTLDRVSVDSQPLLRAILRTSTSMHASSGPSSMHSSSVGAGASLSSVPTTWALDVAVAAITLIALEDILEALEQRLADEEKDGKATGLSSLPGVVCALCGQSRAGQG